ncbi:MAG: hypothetical protein Q9162_006585 [Coniocarpon cinnabarinum]
MSDNGTSIHWHGIRQLNTNAMDGTNGITECPIAPNHSGTYTFRATQFGTSWYHSHHLEQYGDGIFGPIVINGPATANYDIDLGPLLVGDWYYTGSFVQDAIQQAAIQNNLAGPAPDTLLINGTNGVNGGAYTTINLTPGKAHRLRLVNTAVENAVRVSIDSHSLQVIAADFVPVRPVTTDSVLLAIGQRYDVIVNASRKVDNYWMRVTTGSECNDIGPDTPAQAIVRYEGAANAHPSTSSTVTSTSCAEPGVLSPYVENDVGSVDQFMAQINDLDVDVFVPGINTNNQNIAYWGINMSAIKVDWEKPTLQYVRNNEQYPAAENIIEIPDQNMWSYWIIQEVQGGLANLFHPLHLHGHDFYVLGSGVGQFDKTSDPQQLTFKNPTRRDTAQIPQNGWIALAFPADNPGACTATMQAALGILGLRCYHSTLWVSSNLGDTEMWQEAYDAKYWSKGTPYGRRELDELLHNFHAVAEIPACSFVQELLEAYPEAKVILVERDIESWYKSFDQNVISNCWSPFTRIVSRMDRWTLNPIRVTMDKWMEGALGCHSAAEMRAKARSLYTDHNALVRQIAPRERFLDYRLDQGWEPLCRLLGKPIPEEAFPRLNEAAWFQEKIGLLVKRGVWSVLKNGLIYGGAAGIGFALLVTFYRSSTWE